MFLNHEDRRHTKFLGGHFAFSMWHGLPCAMLAFGTNCKGFMNIITCKTQQGYIKTVYDSEDVHSNLKIFLFNCRMKCSDEVRNLWMEFTF